MCCDNLSRGHVVHLETLTCYIAYDHRLTIVSTVGRRSTVVCQALISTCTLFSRYQQEEYVVNEGHLSVSFAAQHSKVREMPSI